MKNIIIFLLLGMLAWYWITYFQSQRRDYKRVTLPPTYSVDLETGNLKSSDTGAQDLWWRAKTRTERCLCPYLQSNALLARVPEEDFLTIEATKLTTLDYSKEGFKHTDNDSEVHPGLTIAVRTVEGNFAKVRVVDIKRDNQLVIEWQVFTPPDISAGKGYIQVNASLEIPGLLDKAASALRNKRQEEAASYLEQVITLTEKLPPGDPYRIEGLSRSGRLYWSLHQLEHAKIYLLKVVDDIDLYKTESNEGTNRRKSLSWELPRETYRMLGIIYRDQRHYEEAIPWFERAIEQGQSAPEGNNNERNEKFFSIVSDLWELSNSQCLAGQKMASQSSFKQLQILCAERPDTNAGVCYFKEKCAEGMTQDLQLQKKQAEQPPELSPEKTRTTDNAVTPIILDKETIKNLINSKYAEFEIKPAMNTQHILVGGREIKAEVHGSDLRIKFEEIRLENRPDKTETNYTSLGINVYPLQSRREQDSKAVWNHEIRGVLSPESPTEILQDQVFIVPGMGPTCKQGCRARLLLGVKEGQNAWHGENTEFAPLIMAPTMDIAIPPPVPSKYWDTYYNRAVSVYKQEHFDEAIQLFNETLDFIEQNLGADHPATARTLVTMVHIYKQQKKFNEYEKYMLRALKVLDKHSDTEVKAMLGWMGHSIDREQVASKLADFYWDQRRYDRSFEFYERAYNAVADLDTTDYSRNLKLAFNSSGIMKTACVLGKWDIADKAMAELKERYKDLEPGAQKEMDYWIRTGEPRLKKRKC